MLRWHRETLIFAVVVLALSSVPLLRPPQYFLYLLVLLLIYIVLSSSWNLVGGYAGQISLGHAAFFGAGAYGAAMAAIAHGGFLVSLVAGGVSASLFAIVASVTFRLKGQYFAIGTLGLSEAARVLMINWQMVGGAGGIRVTAPEGYSTSSLFYFAIGAAVLEFVILGLLVNSNFGLALRAIRSDELAAESLGLNSLKYKVLSLIVSAFFAGLAGALYAFQTLFIEPDSVFAIMWSAMPIVMVIVGGKATLLGPMLGAGVFLSLNELLAPLGEVNSIVVGAVLIGLAFSFRRGIVLPARSTRSVWHETH